MLDNDDDRLYSHETNCAAEQDVLAQTNDQPAVDGEEEGNMDADDASSAALASGPLSG